MRKIVAGLFISLDGVYEAPGEWHFPYFDDDMRAAVGALMEAADTMLLGRVTYEEFAGYWPNADPAENEIADHMNGIPKLVVSNTLQSLAWQNSTLATGDVAARLTALKAQPGKDISITGSGTLVRSLLRDGVLDELHLLVHPIAIGSGKRLFDDLKTPAPLELVRSTTFGSGVLSLVYRPAPVTTSDGESPA